jgi:hypothetical protein
LVQPDACCQYMPKLFISNSPKPIDVLHSTPMFEVFCNSITLLFYLS